MYIESFVVTEENHTIEIPKEFYGMEVKVEITSNNPKESAEEIKRKESLKKAFEYWDNNGRDLSNFKFNREEANER